MRRLSIAVVGLLLSTAIVGCASAPPPEPPPPRSWNDNGPIAVVAATPDPSVLRSAAEEQREHLRTLFDVAERRQLKENGPPVLEEVKQVSRELDRIEARINDVDRNVVGQERDSELELVQLDLRRLQTRVALLEDILR